MFFSDADKVAGAGGGGAVPLPSPGGGARPGCGEEPDLILRRVWGGIWWWLARFLSSDLSAGDPIVCGFYAFGGD